MFPTEIWVGFFSVITFLILLDLGVLVRTSDGNMSSKMSLAMTGAWFVVAMLFASVIGLYRTSEEAALFMTGYLVELALSVDNIFVFILIFSYFKVSQKAQRKVLMIGILSAIVMRLLMISAGIYLIQQFQWIFYIFGVFLIYSGIKIVMSKKDDHGVKGEHRFIAWLKNILPLAKGDHDDKFIVRINKKYYLTTLVLVLILIEKADLIFALDSIPAILSITDNTFIVFTSNIFAILGLRSMYFFLSDMLNKFYYIKYALSFILCYIGFKMIAMVQGLHVPISISLGVIICSVLAAVVFSLLRARISSRMR